MAQGNTGTTLRWLTEEQVSSLVDINDGITALEQGFIDEAQGRARMLDKALGTWPGGAMHALGAMSHARGHAGFKTWVHTAKGATAIFSLFEIETGRLLAVLEAATLGQIRTSAVSGLGARLLASPDARDMALVGTGAQAMTQVAAVAAVRPLRRLRVYSRTPEKRADFVRRARELFDFEIVDCATLEDAVRGAEIVTLMTRTTDPFLHGNMVAPGALLIAAGAILPQNAECHGDVVARADRIVVDSMGNARSSSRELREQFGEDDEAWKKVTTLGELLVRGDATGSADGIAIFKPMGSGLSDLAVASMAYERAERADVGAKINQPQRAAPRWRAVGVGA